ncbi:MAG: single-stranded-DNA-specific exonuclease RecJ [Candidatus Daviesbacteria bacterium]|nr:MAG: single-stranded-DNA-specific exonuclease RecJ [Candidatus Daviesbacteria bacterium]
MQWKIKLQKSKDLIEQLLINRSLKTKKQIEDFFHPQLKDFEKNLKIPGIKEAKKRIEQAIKNEELIIAYGDYDVDGICGAAVLYLGLTSLGAKVLPYIPHREKEGYGLSPIGLDFAKETGAGLVITTDTGIVSYEMAEYCKKLGLDLIITDHHQKEGKKLPQALAIVHSVQLCGAAVTWCLMRSLLSEVKAKELLDLVAIATVADMMPLLEVNRALVKEGLKVLNRTERIGLKTLIHNCKLTLGQIGAYEIGHLIAPQLNAMGRLEHAIDSLRLLCTKDPNKAAKLVDLVTATNEQRKVLTQQTMEEARVLIKEEKNIYLLSSKSWNPGIIGLVAGRIVEETRKPAIIISEGEVHSKGSARSANGLNIVELIRSSSDLLVAVGGHTGAAGFTILSENLAEFKNRIEKMMDGERVSEEPTLEIEALLESSKINLSLLKKLADFEPFGVGNQKPILATKNMRLSDLRTVGNGKHLKGNIIIDFPSEGRKIHFIAFDKGNLLGILQNGGLVDLAYVLDIDTYNGFEKIQLKVRDIKANL